MLLEELEKYYEELLKADLKVIPKKVTTLFDIADFPHYETVISNFYSFYLNPSEQHGLSDLFISVLSDIIKRKTGGHSIIANSKICYTEREVYTDNGKYIDIVVSEPSEFDDVVENAIIIENKVDASVYNDKIKEIIDLYSTIKSDIFKQVDDVCEKLNLGLELQGHYNSKLRYFSSKTAPVYFTIWLDNLFNGDGEIYIFVELNEEGIGHIDKINKIKFTDNEKKLLDETTKVRKTYIHYATKEVKPSPEDIKDFTNYIYNQITQTPLIDIFLKIEKLLKDEKQKGSR